MKNTMFKLGRLPNGLDLLNYFVGLTTMYWTAAAAAVVKGVSDKRAADKAQHARDAAATTEREQAAKAAGYLEPYRQFGEEQLGDLQNWLAGPGGAFQKPTMEEIQATPGYASRLGAIESSAAARGSLFSGNALRDIGEFGASEYDREYNREMGRRQNELNQRLQLVNLGYGAAGGQAGISQGLGSSLSGLQRDRAQADSAYYRGLGNTVSSGLGAYQGQQNWNAFLKNMG